MGRCRSLLMVHSSSDTDWVCFPMTIRYECDVACTPMIVSDSFVKSQKARDVDFTTHPGECGRTSLWCAGACVCVQDQMSVIHILACVKRPTYTYIHIHS